MAEDLADWLGGAGHAALHLQVWPHGRRRPFQEPLGGAWHHPMRIAQRVVARLGLAETGGWEYPLLRGRLREFNADLVHLHDLTATASADTVRKIAAEWPVVWTFHDCAAFTGGCIYPMDCRRYLEHCGRCPQKGEWPLDTLLDPSARNLAARRRLFAAHRIPCSAPSRWLCRLADESGLIPDPVETIPYGLDFSLFRPEDKHAARARLGLDPDGLWILLSAALLSDPRKGVRDALRIIARLKGDGVPVRVLTMGGATDGVTRELAAAGVPAVSLGFVRERERLRLAYSAADLLLLCSYADNQPVAILEAMACGTPVASYRTGGISEMIRDGVDGCLAATGAETDLAAGIREAWRADRIKAWSAAAPESVLARHSARAYLDRHLELYRRVLGGRAAAAARPSPDPHVQPPA